MLLCKGERKVENNKSRPIVLNSERIHFLEKLRYIPYGGLRNVVFKSTSKYPP